MCSAVRRRMLSNGMVSSPVDGAAGAAASLRAIGAVSSGAGRAGATGAVLAAGGGVVVGAGRAAGGGTLGAGAVGADCGGAAEVVVAPCRLEAASRTSLRVMRPPSPLPSTSPASRPYSLSSLRTTGDMSCPPVDAWGGAPEVVGGAPEVVAAGETGSCRGGGVGEGVDGAGRAGCGGAAEVVVVAPAPSEITARRVPTSAVSPSWTRIS